MIKYGYPLTIFSLLWGIQFQVYNYILTISGYLIEISYLNVAIVSGSLIGILEKSISFTLFPIFSKMDWNNNNRDKRKLTEYFQFSIKFGTLLIIPSTILAIIFASQVFPLIFGDKYTAASPFISIYFCIFLLVCFGSLSIPAFFNGQDQTKYVLYIRLVELISIIIFSIIFISLIGAIGIVYGIVSGTVVSVIFGNILIRKKYGNNLFSNLKNVIMLFLIGIISGLIIFVFYTKILNVIITNEGLLFTIIKLMIAFTFYFIIYVCSIGLFSQISIEELEFFERSFAKFPIINKIIIILSKFEKKIIKMRTK